MNKVKYIIFILLITLVLNCSSRNELSSIADESHQKSIAIVVENIISGKILDKKISRPFGLALDFAGKLYLTDQGNDRLIRFDDSLKAERDFGGFGSMEGLLSRPGYLAFDNGLNLIVADERNMRLSRYNTHLNFIDQIDFYDMADPLKFGQPSGIAFTTYGETWVTDREKNRLAVFNNLGKFDRFIGDYGDAGDQLRSPEKIVIGWERSFVVCDAGNQRLVYYDEFGNYDKTLEHDNFQYPIAAFFDKDLLWVLDGYNGMIFCFGRDNKLKASFSAILPGGFKPLKEPSDFILTNAGRLIISDTGNNRLLVCRIIYEK